jgi:hypothetical protein
MTLLVSLIHPMDDLPDSSRPIQSILSVRSVTVSPENKRASPDDEWRFLGS